ncbi:hypothetical protein AAG570_008943 [Ranatra chinensis]|uniref:Uncharacterized protein n=1 Tax=Ranatra chinensis TaxID=642074 RepID=A0ABD0YSH1_9HEMI
MASKRRNMFQKNKTQETTKNEAGGARGTPATFHNPLGSHPNGLLNVPTPGTFNNLTLSVDRGWSRPDLQRTSSGQMAGVGDSIGDTDGATRKQLSLSKPLNSLSDPPTTTHPISPPPGYSSSTNLNHVQIEF